MKKIEWKIQYATGISKIDEQHAYLFDLVNQLSHAIANERFSMVVGGILEELHNYTQTHFAYEESLLEKANYSDLAEHRKKHTRMKEQLELFSRQFREGSLYPEAFSLFLEDWLKIHILTDDLKYAPALGGKL